MLRRNTMQNFESKLTGGHPNSLGNTIAVVEEVLQNPEYFHELFTCYFSNDEIVRLRVSNAMKRICRQNKDLLIPYIDRFLTGIAQIDQASVKWSLSQLFLLLEKHLSATQKAEATAIMKSNLENDKDWIVQNMTMETLGKWAISDGALRAWLLPQLEKNILDHRKSVSKKARKTMEALTS
jgi:hypothetical protein